MNIEKVESAKWQFGAALASLLLLTVLAIFVHSHNPRVAYAFSHMWLAALLTFAAFMIVWGAVRLRLWEKVARAFPKNEAAPYIVALIILFACFWAPVAAFSDFAQDDWRLLAAASERSALVAHPYNAWFELDSVDGNFRPATGLLFVYFTHFFGSNSAPFLALNFVVNLLAVLLLFTIARDLRFSCMTAMLAATLYLSRGMIYTLIGWPCAFGDGFVILMMAAAVWLILRAQRDDGAAIGLHLAAWGFFCCALFAKQSAFAIPAIVFLTILLAPGSEAVQYRQTIKKAALSSLAYLPPVAIVYLHSRALAQGVTPYPIKLTLNSFFHLFSYLSWYGLMVDFGGALGQIGSVLSLLQSVIGLAILVFLGLALYRNPKLYAGRGRVLVYTAMAAAASLALFAFLPNRSAGYYGAMAAFWISLTFAMVLTRWIEMINSARSRQIILAAVCAFVLVGFVDVRLKQTGLIPSGGYLWGTFSGWRDRRYDENMTRVLDENGSGEFDGIVISDLRDAAKSLAAMALLHESPRVNRVLVYGPDPGSWWSNNRAGLRPGSAVAEYADWGAYQWNVALSAERAREIQKGEVARWIFFTEGGELCGVQTSARSENAPASCL